MKGKTGEEWVKGKETEPELRVPPGHCMVCCMLKMRCDRRTIRAVSLCGCSCGGLVGCWLWDGGRPWRRGAVLIKGSSSGLCGVGAGGALTLFLMILSKWVDIAWRPGSILIDGERPLM